MSGRWGVHTLVVEDPQPYRTCVGRDEDGRGIWEVKADKTSSAIRCIECDQHVGAIYDELTDQQLRAWWMPDGRFIALGDRRYWPDDDDLFSRAASLADLVATMRECHQVHMDALHTPMPRRRRTPAVARP